MHAWYFVAMQHAIQIESTPLNGVIRDLGEGIHTCDAVLAGDGRVYVSACRKRIRVGRLAEDGDIDWHDVPDSDGAVVKMKSPRLVASGNQLTIAWTVRGGLVGRVAWASLENPGEWQMETFHSGDDGFRISNPALAVDHTGTIHLLASYWREGLHGESAHYFLRTPSASWQHIGEIAGVYEYRIISANSTPDGVYFVVKGWGGPSLVFFAAHGQRLTQVGELPRQGRDNALLGSSLWWQGRLLHLCATFPRGEENQVIDLHFLPEECRRLPLAIPPAEYDVLPALAGDAERWVGTVAVRRTGTGRDAVYLIDENRISLISETADLHSESFAPIVLHPSGIMVFFRGPGGTLHMYRQTAAAPQLPGETDEVVLRLDRRDAEALCRLYEKYRGQLAAGDRGDGANEERRENTK